MRVCGLASGGPAAQGLLGGSATARSRARERHRIPAFPHIAMKTAPHSLQKDILDELQWEPSLDSSRIGVSIEKGVAVLTGHVRNLVERGIAERAAGLCE